MQRTLAVLHAMHLRMQGLLVGVHALVVVHCICGA